MQKLTNCNLFNAASPARLARYSDRLSFSIHSLIMPIVPSDRCSTPIILVILGCWLSRRQRTISWKTAYP